MNAITHPSDALKQTQQKASYFIIAVVMWEFFSYFGMQAMLILYLTQELHFSDSKAFELYGNFTSLIFMTPILGGWLADRFCGYRYAVMWGSILIILGHLILGSFTEHGLYLGLAVLILGIGLFKSNAICLIGDCYPNDSARKSAAFSWYYVSGNIGAIISQMLCPYAAQAISWHAGFMIAAIGMVLGLIALILSKPYFSWQKEQSADISWKRLSFYSQISISIGVLIAALFIAYFALFYAIVGYLLMAISVVSLWMFYKIYSDADTAKKKLLRVIAVLTLFATGFWIFDQQGSSSVSLFISRFVDLNVNHYLVPAGSLQSITPTMILIMGTVMAFGWRILGNKGISPSPISKMSIALLLLVFGFMILAHAGMIANTNQLAAIAYPIFCLMLVGTAEIFVDPVLLTAISDASPAQAEGRLVAIYYLAVGAVANYLAAWVAKFTVDPSQNTATALTYSSAYSQISYIAGFMFVMLFFWVCKNRYKRWQATKPNFAST